MTTLLLLLAFGPTVNLTLEAKVTLRGADITLADVLTPASIAALEAVEGTQLLQERLARGPGFSSARTIHRDLVDQFVHRALPQLELVFDGPYETLVHRQGGVFSESSVEQAVREFVRDEAERAERNVEVLKVQVPKVLKIPTGPIVYRVRSRPNRPLIGRQAYYVDMLVEGENFQTIVVPTELAQTGLVAVSARDLERGEGLSAGEVVWEERLLDRAPAAPIRREDAALLRTRMAVRAGVILTAANTEVRPLVERRQTVTVTAMRGDLTISLRAEALDSGAKGERVRLKNLESGQQLSGTVVDAGQVNLD